jgi:hypothetical protein
MNADTFAEWFRRQGYRVVRTPSSYWYEAGARVYQAFPYHWLIEPTEGELRGLLLKHNAIALRYSAPVTHPRGKVSYHVVCQDPAYDLPSLSRQARQNVRRGLGYASIEPIPMARLAGEGWKLRQDSLERQGRPGAETEDGGSACARVRRICPALRPGGPSTTGSLWPPSWPSSATAALPCPTNRVLRPTWSTGPTMPSFSPSSRKRSVAQGISEVFFCLHSLDAPGSVDQFKFRMGCTAKPVRQRVAFHPLLAARHWRRRDRGGRGQALRSGWITTGPRTRTFERAAGRVCRRETCHRGQLLHSGAASWLGRRRGGEGRRGDYDAADVLLHGQRDHPPGRQARLCRHRRRL